jgi:hypothetical protein
MVYKWQEHHKRTVDKAIDKHTETGKNDNVLDNHSEVNDAGRLWRSV